MAHDFKNFPELRANQMEIYYFDSPHKQIFEDFKAKVVKVIDGDTVRVSCDFRDFTFPVRILDLAAPELDEGGGKESQSWLESQILGEDVDIIMTAHRVEKWGRLLGGILFRGIDMAEESVRQGHAVPWEERKTGHLPDFNKEIERFIIK